MHKLLHYLQFDMCWNITGSDLTQKAFCQIDLEQQTHNCTHSSALYPTTPVMV